MFRRSTNLLLAAGALSATFGITALAAQPAAYDTTVLSTSTAPVSAALTAGAAGGSACGPVAWGVLNGKTWGGGQVCWTMLQDGTTIWRVAVADTLTDGYCTEGYRLTNDKMAWVEHNPRVRACPPAGSTGWKTKYTNPPFNGERVYRGGDGGAYFRVPLP